VFRRHYATIRATEKALILLVCATLLVQVGDSFHFAALLGIITIGFVLLEHFEEVARELASKLSKIWVFAEIILFVMIGFSLEPSAAFEAGFRGLLAISGGLVFRSLGVWVATAFSPLTVRERLFCPSPTFRKRPSRQLSAASPCPGGFSKARPFLQSPYSRSSSPRRSDFWASALSETVCSKPTAMKPFRSDNKTLFRASSATMRVSFPLACARAYRQAPSILDPACFVGFCDICHILCRRNCVE